MKEAEKFFRPLPVLPLIFGVILLLPLLLLLMLVLSLFLTSVRVFHAFHVAPPGSGGRGTVYDAEYTVLSSEDSDGEDGAGDGAAGTSGAPPRQLP